MGRSYLYDVVIFVNSHPSFVVWSYLELKQMSNKLGRLTSSQIINSINNQTKGFTVQKLCLKCIDIISIIRKIKIMFETIINPQKGIKTFVFQKQETQQSIIIDYEIDLRQNLINLSYLLTIYCPTNQHKVSIYDPNTNQFVCLKKLGADNGFIHKQYLEPRIIMIRYRRCFICHNDSDSIDSNLEPDSTLQKRDGRSKQRSIAQVIELVKKWRNLHLHGHKTLNRRLNLQDAAKLVGISKKSLDDYYCQLRLGQFYHFNFANKLNEKMGVLRSYVKDYKPQKEQKKRQNQKHPKNLRVIQQFSLQTKTLTMLSEQQLMVENNHKNQTILPEYNISQINHSQQGQNFAQQRFEENQADQSQVFAELFNLQHDFFKGFQLVLDEPSDPYVQIIDRDFRKKDFDEDSNSFLFF